MIGIRLADHSIFPVLTADAPEGKRVVLTTARDTQERVDIELVQSDGHDSGRRRPVMLGRVTLDDLQREPGDEPEIDLVLSLTSSGNLDVTATNRATGTARSISIDVERVVTEADFSVPQSLTDGFEPELAPPPAEEPRSRTRGWLLVIVLLLLVAVLAVGAWWLLVRDAGETPTPRSSQEAPAAPAANDSTPADPESTEDGSFGLSDSGQARADGQSPTDQSDTESATTETIPDSNSVEYRIRRGDTLWDISETFYGTPWMFSELADANEISNPNLIFAESDLEIPDQLRRSND